jgi:hypothetical protein
MKRRDEDVVDAAPQKTLGSISFWPMLHHTKQRIGRLFVSGITLVPIHTHQAIYSARILGCL